MTRASIVTAAVLCAGLSAIAAQPTGLYRWPDQWTPYVERIKPDEIHLIEKNQERPFSAESELVVYQCDEDGQIFLAYILRHADAEYQLRMLRWDDETRALSQRGIRLDSSLSGKLIDAVEFVLSKQIFPISPRGGDSANGRSVIWIYRRNPDGSEALGKLEVPIARCWVGMPRSEVPLLDVFYRMRRCFEKHEPGYGSPLTELDFALAELRLSYPK